MIFNELLHDLHTQCRSLNLLKSNIYEGLGTVFGWTVFEEGFYGNIIIWSILLFYVYFNWLLPTNMCGHVIIRSLNLNRTNRNALQLLTSANTLFFSRQDTRCVNDANALQDLVGDLRADEPGGTWRESLLSVTKANTGVSITTVYCPFEALGSETADANHPPSFSYFFLIYLNKC